MTPKDPILKMYFLGMVLLISLATHEKTSCEPSCIDNIFVSNIDKVIASGLLHETKVSHHYPTVCFYNLSISECKDNPQYSSPKYDYCESNMIQFSTEIPKKLEEESFCIDEDGFEKFSN